MQKDNLIDRQAALDICNAAIDFWYGMLGEGALVAVRDKISGLSPVQSEPQWIPVSERLPEDTQFVLLTVRRLKDEYNHGPFISVGYIGWNQQHWWCAHDGDCEISKIEVIAWMPLPKPFKGGVE